MPHGLCRTYGVLLRPFPRTDRLVDIRESNQARNIPRMLAADIEATILGVDRQQPAFAVQPMTEVVAKSIAQRKLSPILLAYALHTPRSAR